MKKLILFVTIAVVSMLIAGCAPPAANTANTTNNNANANVKPASAPPTVAALKDLEMKAFEAWKNKDGKFFEGMLDDKFVMGGMSQKMDKAATVKMMSESKCTVNNYTLSDEKMIPLGADNALITSKLTVDATCDGEKQPSPVIAASMYTRSGDTWKGVYHNEVPIVDPKTATTSAPKPPTMNPPANSNTASKSNANMASNSNNSNSNASNSAAASTSSDMTAAWLELEKKGWEAWRTKDAKWYEDNLYKDFFLVDLFGQTTATKADTIKMWTTDNKCDIKSTSVTDASSVSLGKDAGFLMFKGSAVGSCEGMTIKPVYGTTFLVKDGDAWKAAAIIENLAS
ncbi:MAG: nuclear transport factor 2 family protein [Pyrinomonadaceae bacterium]